MATSDSNGSGRVAPFHARGGVGPTRRIPAAEIAAIAALSALYIAAGKLGLAFASINPSSTPLWAPAGIALAAFLLFGYRLWPVILVSAFVVNVTTAGSIATSLAIAAGNTLEGIVGAYLVNRFAGGRRVFERAQDIFKFAVLAGMASTMLSATIGVTALAAAGYARWPDYGAIWLTWWLGDASGDLLIAPLIVLWSGRSGAGALRGRALEVLLMAATTMAAAMLIFGGILPAGMRNYPLEFMCLPILLWPAFRFGERETASAAALLSGIALWGTLHGMGPFVLGAPNPSLLLLQTFMATMAMTSIPVAALMRERKRAEALAVEARTVAESANRAKDDFLAMLGHELRNPLGAIGAAIYVLEHSGADAMRESRAKSIISRQVKHLVRLVDDLLDVARLTTGRIVLQREPLNLADSISEAIAAVRLQDTRHDLQVDAAALWVEGDPDRIAQIIGNLLSNAVRYTPAGGMIRVSLAREGESGVMRVEDSGAGIASARLPHVFDLFGSGAKSSASESGGLGIGLPLVDRLVRLHGGTVEAWSAGAGHGSTFTVRLPLIEQPPAAAAQG